MPRVNAEQNKTPPKGQFYDGRRLRSLPPQPSFVNKRRRIDPDSDYSSTASSSSPIITRKRLKKVTSNISSRRSVRNMSPSSKKKMAASEKAASHPARPPRSVRSPPANKTACSPPANKTAVDSSTPSVVAPGLVTLAETSAQSTIATTPSVTTAATTPSETTTTAASEPTAPSESTSSHSDAHQLILLRNSMKIDSTFRLQLRIDFVKGGKDRISATNFKIFDSQFETLDFSDCMSSFSKVIFPVVLEYMASVYGTSEKSVFFGRIHKEIH